MSEFEWVLSGRCYRLGHDVPHAGGVIPNRYIVARQFDPGALVPHLFEETDPGFHERARPGDIIVTGTPSGVALGMKPPKFLNVGDVVELGCDGLGTQKQKIVKARA